jgi:hypothetical protein
MLSTQAIAWLAEKFDDEFQCHDTAERRVHVHLPSLDVPYIELVDEGEFVVLSDRSVTVWRLENEFGRALTEDELARLAKVKFPPGVVLHNRELLYKDTYSGLLAGVLRMAAASQQLTAVAHALLRQARV